MPLPITGGVFVGTGELGGRVGGWIDYVLCGRCAGRVGAEDATFPAEVDYYDPDDVACPRCGSRAVHVRFVEEG